MNFRGDKFNLGGGLSCKQLTKHTPPHDLAPGELPMEPLMGAPRTK